MTHSDYGVSMVITSTSSMQQPCASNWINGVERVDGMLKESINPATYEVIGSYPDNGLAMAMEAVAAASAAFRQSVWAHDQALRAKVLDKLAAAFERNRNRLQQMLSLENGK